MVAPVGDPDGVVAELVARVAGFGALQPLLDDPTVEEVWINSPDRVFVARNGRHELTNLVLSEVQVNELVERMLKTTGRRVDLSRPFVDAMLPQGHRLRTWCCRTSAAASPRSTRADTLTVPMKSVARRHT